MQTKDILKYLSDRGIEADCIMDRRNTLSGRLIRCVYKDTPLMVVGGEHSKEHQLNTVLDGIHWHLINFGIKGTVRIIIGSGVDTLEVLDAIAILLECYQGQLKIEIEVDFIPQNLTVPDFSRINKRNWLTFFQQQGSTTPPALAIKLTKLVDHESFRWYRSVTRGDWSGRVEGLEVCRVGPDPDYGELNIGKPGKNGNIGKARKLFLEIAKGREGSFDISRIDEVVSVIRQVAISREKGELRNVQEEHHLESRILRGASQINVNVESPLEPVIKDYPFQFPTLWSPRGSARFLDVLMRNKDVPWAVELKVPSQGGGEKYRHAISQAVLYREFIRRASQVHPWFNEQDMDANKCKAVVAFPKMKAGQKEILTQHRAVGELFDVKIVEINE